MQLIQFKNSPVIPYDDKQKINLIFYKCFEKYAIKIAIDFKKMHYYKCKNIFTNDIIFASKIGLYKAVQKFNGSSPFTQFCTIYIHSELYKLLTDTYSLTIVPRSYRKKSKFNLTTLEKIRYKKLLKISLSDDEYQFNNLKNVDVNSNDSLHKYNELEKIRTIWSIIDTLDPFSKRIMHLKYDYLFNKQRTNKHVAFLMCCSE
jgi:DNA-directed RNA polymerase specialized sigma subunit